MAKILVFQHVPYEPLGLLDPMLRRHKHRIRYVNFGRDDATVPALDNYAALIVLGGPMNIGQEAEFPHLELEKRAILQAMELQIPILGICLGAQLVASALGAKVYPAESIEIGWHPVNTTDQAAADPLAKHFSESEQIFQWHGHTFDLPPGATPLISGELCANQAFRMGNSTYGLQFHLEACESVIERWLTVPQHEDDLAKLAPGAAESIRQQNHSALPRSKQLAEKVFGEFIGLLPAVRKQHRLRSR
ncbi:gamma-glutamyl-gamma-aminobutyrate hydrolase family protein [Porticoccus sp. W117]|uniref:glutamine amidotransferase-related protein n=1 Tax=Porticoccus sp. W117 TaxID=3054777 RepID=UPI0025923947|nr:gamma-glutamyl-gamma-aminobutyrate hydrolase family protein [Porticoccus sp. W117]MDM3870702.1 gamma-glutamyl-gamma-aminobutyrate hydrolase family protein [Porticoccus sp. W117]